MTDEQTHKRTEVISAYIRLFNTEDGVTVLNDLMRAHGMLSTSYSKDTVEMAFNEGSRNVVLRLLSILQIDVTKLRERIYNES